MIKPGYLLKIGEYIFNISIVKRVMRKYQANYADDKETIFLNDAMVSL